MSDTCTQGENWNITGTDNPFSGWVECTYNYDFSDYAFNNPNNNVFIFSQWLSDVFSGTSSSAPQGMDNTAKNRIRDANIVYAIITDLYNQMYNFGYYQTAPLGTNSFNTYDFISNGFQSYIKNYIISVEGYFANLYSSFPSDLEQVLENAILPPRPFQTGTSYYLSVQLTWPQYTSFQNSTDQTGFIGQLIGFMLKDPQGQFSSLSSQQEWSPGNPIFSNPVTGLFTAIQLVDQNGDASYQVINDIVPWEWTTEKYGNCIFGSAEITVAVQTWSPMLVVYFSTFNSTISFDTQTCNLIASQCGQGCVGKATIPESCFSQMCVDGQSCKQTMGNFCSLEYTPPSNISEIETDATLITNNNDNCMCYTSTLPPAIETTPGNPAAMCFDSNCTANIRTDFGLSDATCAQYCNTVWGWMNSSNPATQSGNQEYMDWVRFNSICGKNFKPYFPPTTNVSVLVPGVTTSILCGLLTFSIAKHKNFRTSSTIVMIIVVVLILIGLTIFLSKDLAGVSSCNGKEFVCTSKITKKKIPSEFCDVNLNCECEFDQDCSGGCVCASSTCRPQVGTRTFKTISERVPNVPLAAASIGLAIILPATLVYLHDDYHWKIGKKPFTFIVIALGLIMIGIAIYSCLRKKNRQVFSGPCCTPKCDGKTCGDDGCGGSCGTCSSGSVCTNGVCTTPIHGCPYPSPNLPSIPASLPSGSYSVQYIINSKGTQEISVLNMASNFPVSVVSSTVILPVNYDSVNMIISYDNGASVMVAKDLCLNTVCGNDRGIVCTQQNGLPSGVVYTMPSASVDATIPHRFILGQNYIYSVDAQAYIVPDQRPMISGTSCPNCPQGGLGTNCYLTYTTNPSEAAVWTVKQLNAFTDPQKMF